MISTPGWKVTMREPFVSIKEIERIKPPVNMDDFPSHEIRRMVVLFSDVAGAAQYAGMYGEASAEKMLRLHQDIVSSSVHSHGGFFVKTVGDAAMAVFLDPKNAVRAAVSVQQNIKSHNKIRTSQEDRLRVRIGIHFGNGILEMDDIIGDVVNICAKIVHLAEIDEVVISRPVYEVVNRLTPLNFEPAGFPREKALKHLPVYRVNWGDAPEIASELNALLYLKPVWAISNDIFSDDWNEILKKKRHFWEKSVAEEILSDKSSALVFETIEDAIDAANEILGFLARNEDKTEPYRPASVQAVVDYGPYLSGSRVAAKNLTIDWGKIDPGVVHISPLAFRLLENATEYLADPAFRLDRIDAFHRLATKSPAQKGAPILFLYQCNLVHGKNVPCFYCGTRKHQAINCPSKKMRDPGQSLEKMGYMPLDLINRLFFLYLTQSDSRRQSRDMSGDNYAIADEAFNELKYIFQLRFFSKIWDSSEEDWERVKTGKTPGRKKGGKVWLAFDCIRISNLTRAETLLIRAMQENPEDYKAFCALGFLFIERTRFREAANYFNRALELAQTKPQAMFVLFLMSRMHLLTGDLFQAEKAVRHILLIDPRCSEAIFQNIVFRFHQGPEEKALANLASFLRDYPEYYVNALIDPDFAPFNRAIHPKLGELLGQAKTEAENIAPTAQREIEYLEKLFGKNDSSLREVNAVSDKIKELCDTKSYLGYLDVVHYVNLVSVKSNGVVEHRKSEIHDQIYQIGERCRHLFTIVDTLSDVALRLNVRSRLADIKNEVEKTNDMLRSDDPDRFKKTIDFSESCTLKLSQIENELKRFGSKTGFQDYFISFLKWSALFQSINLAAGVLLYFINTLLPDIRISTTIRIGVFAFGFMAGVLLAFIASALRDSEE